MEEPSLLAKVRQMMSASISHRSFILSRSSGGDKVLLNYIQESPADHVDPKDVLNSLGIKTEGASAE